SWSILDRRREDPVVASPRGRGYVPARSPSRSERRGSLPSQFRLGGPDRARVSRLARCEISTRGPCLNTIRVFGRASAAKFARDAWEDWGRERRTATNGS